MNRRVGLTAVLLALLVLVLVVGIGGGAFAGLWPYVLAWAVFGAAVWALRGVPGRPATYLVIAGGIAVAATGLLAPPVTSTDSYRYAWDGRVQSAGISPYDHTPDDARLAPLRDSWLFPQGAGCEGPGRYPVPSGDAIRSCTRINRPAVHTIYPPLAEAYFLLVDRLSPEGARHKPLQVGGAVLALATSAALLLALRRRGGGGHLAACWAWCPAVPLEAVNNAHVDTLGVLLAVVALGVVRRPRSAGGALLGAAVATKLLPALAVPGALSGILGADGTPMRRRVAGALKVLVPAGLVVVLAYLPYALVSRESVLGYLFGYLSEEGYRDAGSRNRYALLRLVLPESWALPAVLVVVAVAVFHVLRRGDPDRPWRGALLVTGLAFLALTPGYSWYGLLVVALVALDGRWEWLGVPLAGAVAYLGGQGDLGTLAYAAAALAVLGGHLLRRTRGAAGSSAARRTGGLRARAVSAVRRTGGLRARAVSAVRRTSGRSPASSRSGRSRPSGPSA